MPTELYDAANVFAPAFTFDADLRWSEVHPYQVTERAVESRGAINDYIAQKPVVATLEGKVTAMPPSPLLPDQQKLVDAADALKALGDKCGLVLVMSDLYAGELAITQLEISQSADDGKCITARVEFAAVTTTTTATAQIPASRLASKVKRRAAAAKKGGAAKGSEPPKKVSSVAAKVFDAFGIGVPTL